MQSVPLESSFRIIQERKLFTASVERRNNNSDQRLSLCMCALSEDKPEHWHTRSVVRLVVSGWSPLSLLSLFFSLFFSFMLSLQSLVSHEHTIHPSAHKHIYCINMQILADTNTHTYSRSQQAVCSDWVSYCTGCLSLSSPSRLVNSAAHWCRTQEPDTHLLNRLAWVFPRPASNTWSVPTLH